MLSHDALYASAGYAVVILSVSHSPSIQSSPRELCQRMINISTARRICTAPCCGPVSVCVRCFWLSNWFSVQMLPSAYPTLCFMGIRVSPKISALSSGNLDLDPNSERSQFLCLFSTAHRLWQMFTAYIVRPSPVYHTARPPSFTIQYLYTQSVARFVCKTQNLSHRQLALPYEVSQNHAKDLGEISTQ